MSLARCLPILPKVAGNSLPALCYSHAFPLRPPLPRSPSSFFFESYFPSLGGAKQKNIDRWHQERQLVTSSAALKRQSRYVIGLKVNLQRFLYRFESAGIPSRLVLFAAQTPKCFCARFFFPLNKAKPFLKAIGKFFPNALLINSIADTRGSRLIGYTPQSRGFYLIVFFIFPKQLCRRDATSLMKLLRSSTHSFTRTSVTRCSRRWPIQAMCVSRSSLATFLATRPRDIHTDLFKRGRFSFNFLHIHKRVSHPRSRFPFQL